MNPLLLVLVAGGLYLWSRRGAPGGAAATLYSGGHTGPQPSIAVGEIVGRPSADDVGAVMAAATPDAREAVQAPGLGQSWTTKSLTQRETERRAAVETGQLVVKLPKNPTQALITGTASWESLAYESSKAWSAQYVDPEGGASAERQKSHAARAGYVRGADGIYRHISQSK